MSRNRRSGWATAGLAAAAVALATVGAAVAPLAVAQGVKPAPAGKAGRGKARGKNVNPNANANAAPAPAKKGDPLEAPAKGKDAATARPAAGGTFHFRMKIHAFDDATLVANYYPARLDTASPVVMLVHEKERSSLDFEKPIDELKKQNLAEHLQNLGYAVLSFDLRGHGANARRPLSEREWADMVDDLQAAYLFLVDRHNRGELNLAKLGVVALGEGANLAAAWAHLPGGAVSQEGRTTDLAGLAMVSPLPAGSGFPFSAATNALAPRVPVLLIAGERDAPSHDAIKKVRANVERTRQSRVELFPSSLHGYRLLNLEPRAATVVVRFLDSTVKLKSSEWEPRFNLTPVAYTDITVVVHARPADAGKEKPREVEKPAAREKEAPRAAEKKEAEKDKDKD